MESAGNSSGQDANNRPPVDRGPGNGGRGVNPNRDSPNGYSTDKHAELQPVTLSH